MTTGISCKQKNSRKIPVLLSYEGKLNEAIVLTQNYSTFVNATEINGEQSRNSFFFGDNIDVLLFLLNNGYRAKINLVYIDPPFATKSKFVSRTQDEAYHDNLSGAEYVEFLRERLIILRELLCKTGSIYLHLDNKMAFNMKIIMDEIFGEDNCRAFITRKKCSTKNYTKNTYGNVSDFIMFYSKTSDYVWHRPYTPWKIDNLINEYPCVDEKTGRRYKKVPIHAPGVRNGETGKEWHGILPPLGKHWQYTPAKLDELDAAGEIYWSPTGNPRRKVYYDANKGIPMQDLWLNYSDSINQSLKTTGYPTEKNFEMLKMIIEASSNKGDIVLDCFAGSGTTLGAAFETGRTWIGADNSMESLKAVLKRFTEGLDVYGDYVTKPKYIQQTLDIAKQCHFSVFSSKEHFEAVVSMVKAKCGDKCKFTEGYTVN